jgi:Prokaryotic N-terminal methylation motif
MKKSGFTLLEVIIYCALFSVLMTGSIVTVYALLGTSDATTKSTNIVAEATFINQKFAWVFFGATSVQVIDSKTIKIIRPDLGTDSPLIVSETGGVLYLSRGGANPLRLTGDTYILSGVSMNVAGSMIVIDYTIDNMPLRFETYIH